jgi:zinc transport system ATP-binding protein
MNPHASSSPSVVATHALLQARGLCKFYGAREVLHEVSLTIEPREIVTVVGPNGAGKTTLLRCLLGLERPDHGTVVRLPGIRIGYVPQHFTPQASLPLTVGGFLALYGEWTPALQTALKLEALLPRALHTLSGGELRRVLLARALLNHPHLLVLDEPTAGIDVGGQGELYRLLRQLSETYGFAVLMVSHDLHVVMAATERVICLNRHICCEGLPQQVGNAAAFRELFGDTVADQLALYHHHHSHTHGLDEDTACTHDAPHHHPPARGHHA